uniref:Uncharacterized protein n=1 Tax=Lepeophtheirus salmonis TaxID=72036 RepID=A0A0K2UBJ6_LEPSM
MAVHLPVPFCPAESRIFSSKGDPSVSLYLSILVDISIKKESNSLLFHSLNILDISSCDKSKVPFIKWYASQMSCMSPYSIPLWTIFTKWPDPSSPTQSQHGSPLDFAQIAWKMGLI